MEKTGRYFVVAVLIGLTVQAMAVDTLVSPGNIGSGSLSITGTGTGKTYVNQYLDPEGYNFVEQRFSCDLSGGPAALQGFVNVSQAALADAGGLSKYFGRFVIRDNGGRLVYASFANQWQGQWNELAAHPWDGISLETKNVVGFSNETPLAQQYFATVGVPLPRLGATVYPAITSTISS
jgi:hypothetical protein